MNGLRISLFGAFRVSDLADRPLKVRARKNRALLAVLATAPGKRHAREWLAELLWENHAEEQARASLRQALSTLRRDLGPGAAAVHADGEGVWLDPERVEVDLIRLQRLLETRDADALSAATGRLVAGPFLEGLELRESAFRNWLEPERRRAHAMAARVLRRAAAERIESDPEAALDSLQRCIELEPDDESLHRELMRVRAAAGRTAEALQHYERLCRRLETELSARPAAETERLAAELREGRPTESRTESGLVPGVTYPRSPNAGAESAEDAGVRQAVVVCGRFEPSAARHGGHEPAGSRASMDTRLAEAEAIVESHGGRFHRRSGNGFLGVFGLEHARGSEAERAARSALELQEWQSEIRSPGKDGPHLHCVVTAGAVMAVAGEVTGRPVERAEDIVARIPGQSLLIDDTTRRLLDEHADLFVEPVQAVDDESVWRLDALDYAAASAPRTPFVGRAYELAEIDRALEGTRRDQCAHLVLLRGEAGIGKTRLLQEAGDHGRALGFEWHATTMLDFGVAEGEGAIATLVRSLLGERAVERRADVEALVVEGLLAADEEPFILDLLDIPQPASMRAIYSAMDADARRRGQVSLVAGLINRRCREHAVLVSVEDIHWADATTLRMLAELALHMVDRPVVLIMTTRIEGDPIDRAWLASRRGVPMVTLDLAPLAESDSRMLAGLHGDLAEETIANCVERSGGNPLFLVQLLLAAREPASATVPATIRSLVQVRVDALEPDHRRALQVAAVLGQRFRAEELDNLAETVPDYEALVGGYLVQPEGQGYAFTHALIRDAILESMLADRRRALHARAAEWFRDRDPVLHAQHLDAAEDPAAPAAYLEAARQQAGAFRYNRAADLLERGIALSDDSDEKSRLLMARGEVLTDAGRMHDAIAVLREAERESSDSAQHCRILVDIAAAMRVTDQIDEALELLKQAQPLAEQAGLETELARLCELRGSLEFPRGHVRECLQWQERARTHARSAGSPALEAQALGGLSDAYYALGYLLRARDAYVRCVELAEEQGLGRIAVGNMVQIASLHKYVLDLDGGLQYAQRAYELARKVGHRRAQMAAHMSMAFLLIETGAAEAVLDHIERADVIVESLESKRFAPRILHYRAKAHQLLGDHEKAAELLNQACELCRSGDTAFVGPSACAALALATRERQSRHELLREAREMLDRGAVFHNIVEYHRDAIEVALDEGDAGEATALADALESAMSHEPTPFTDCLVERARLLALWHEGDRSSATTAGLEHLLQRLREASFHILSSRVDAALSRVGD